ncbi:hypothetical protein RD136_004580 [Salmonella enterica]|nr:hypothetical protein [Salmonella enterica]
MTHHAVHNGAVFFNGVDLAPTHAGTDEPPRHPTMVGCYVYLSGYAYPGWFGIFQIISQCITPDRPLIAKLLDNLFADFPVPASDATNTAGKKCLRAYNGLGYVYLASQKTGAGICTPCKLLETPDAAGVCFCCPLYAPFYGVVRHTAEELQSPPDCYPLVPCRQRMAMLAGEPQGRPVSW